MLIASIGAVVGAVLVVVAVAVGLVLFFRRNPDKQAAVNKAVDSVAKKL